MHVRIVLVLVALVLAALGATALAVTPGVRTKAAEDGITTKALDVRLNTQAASGQSASIDREGFGECTFAAILKILTGGTSPTVAVTSETSPNDADWFTGAAVGASMSAVGQTREDRADRLYHRYVRVVWVTTGAPTAAETEIHIQCGE